MVTQSKYKAKLKKAEAEAKKKLAKKKAKIQEELEKKQFKKKLEEIKKKGLTKKEQEFLKKKEAELNRKVKTVKKKIGGAFKSFGRGLKNIAEDIGDELLKQEKKEIAVKNFISKVRVDLKTNSLSKDRLKKVLLVIDKQYGQIGNKELKSRLKSLEKAVVVKLKKR